MDRQDLARRLLRTFVGELEDHVRTLNRDLLALEKDQGERQTELLTDLHRVAHSLKGAARSVNVGVVEAACHRLEEILSGVRDGTVALEPTLLQLLFTVVDALDEVGGRLRHDEELTGSTLEALVPVLDDAGGGRSVPAPAAPSPAIPASGRQPGEEGYVRVPAAKLDALLNSSGELLVVRRRVARRHEDVVALLAEAERAAGEWQRAGRFLPRPRDGTSPFAPVSGALARMESGLDRLLVGLQADHQLLDKAAGPLEEEIHRVRMQPFSDACEGLERTVRDLGQAAGKEADLVIDGGDVELDRSILQALMDPLLHLVRNAVDHGVEPPAERQAQGKARRARIIVSAVLKGPGVEVTVEDDGRGLVLAAVSEAARGRDIPVPEEPTDMARLVFLPGFSTASGVTEVSGRGVGLDVVRSRVERFGGSVDVSSRPGAGTRFVLTLPLTLTTIRVLLVRCAGHVFALPVAAVDTLLRVDIAELTSVEGRAVLLTGNGPVPAVALAEVIGMPLPEPVPQAARAPFVILSNGEHQAAVAVEELLDEQEVVVKSLGPRLQRVRHVSGATILSDGRVALILSPADLVRSVRSRRHGHLRQAGVETKVDTHRKRLLVVDDSVTTRSLERSILEAAGYEVAVAADGAEAWRALQEQGFDLVVADVEMPGMDGFQLTEAIRASAGARQMPVVLVTARDRDEDRRRGLEAGADAYLPKSSFDQTALLDAVTRLL